MKLQIEQPCADAMLEVFPALMPLRDRLHFGNRVEIACNQLSGNELAFLHERFMRRPVRPCTGAPRRSRNAASP